MSTENTKINIFDNTVLIGAISVFGYMSAFSYEYGYLTYYGVPSSFIEINPTNIFISASALLGIFVALFLIINIFSIFGLINNDTAIGRSRFLIAIWIIPLALSKIFIYGSMWKEWLLAVLVALFFIIVEFIWPIIFQKDKMTLEEKFLNQEKIDSKIQDKDLLKKIMMITGRTPLLFIFIAFFFLYTAKDIGRSEAMKQKVFPIVMTESPSVAIRVYSQSIITVSFDKETKTLQKKIFVLSKENLYQQGLYLDYQDIGYLIPAK